MNFIEAYKLMKQGKRCRCKSACSEEDAIYYYGKDCIRCEISDNNGSNQCVIDKEFIEATDWEIVKEKSEDWTDLTTIAEWRERVTNRKEDLKDIGTVKITEDLGKEFNKNYHSNFLKGTLYKIEGIKVIVEENTLSDKIEIPNEVGLCDKSKILYVDDVKASIYEYLNRLRGRTTTFDEKYKIAKEIFGEDLI